jgi:hypothetical protein
MPSPANQRRGAKITPLINQIRGRIKNGVISGQDFDNLVGAGSPLHDLVGDVDNPFVKPAGLAGRKAIRSTKLPPSRRSPTEALC